MTESTADYFDYEIAEDTGIPTIRFRINMFVPGKESVEVVNGRGRMPAKSKRAMKAIRDFLGYNKNLYGLKTHEGPVSIDLEIRYKWKNKRKKMPETCRMKQRPDVDNIQKTLYDGIEKSRIIKNDSQIDTILGLKKRWTEDYPYVVVKLLLE